jgi:hypothetical protein
MLMCALVVLQRAVKCVIDCGWTHKDESCRCLPINNSHTSSPRAQGTTESPINAINTQIPSRRLV